MHSLTQTTPILTTTFIPNQTQPNPTKPNPNPPTIQIIQPCRHIRKVRPSSHTPHPHLFHSCMTCCSLITVLSLLAIIVVLITQVTCIPLSTPYLFNFFLYVLCRCHGNSSNSHQSYRNDQTSLRIDLPQDLSSSRDFKPTSPYSLSNHLYHHGITSTIH